MKKAFKWLIGLSFGLVGMVVLLLAGGLFVINTEAFQNKMLGKAVEMLEEKLQTRVDIDSVSVDLLTLDAELYGLLVEDRQHRKMLQLEKLRADVDILPLLQNEVRISEVKLSGVKAELHKVPHDSIDSIANYQFVIDAFKKDKSKQRAKEKKKGKKTLLFTVNAASADHIEVQYNCNVFSLGSLSLLQSRNNKPHVKIQDLKAQWEKTNKKGWHVDNAIVVGTLVYEQQEDSLHTIEIADLRFRNDNHHPRKNDGKPKRGFFDAEHVNLLANLKVEIDHVGKDSVHGYLRQCTARDSIMGIDIRDLHTTVAYGHKQLHLKDLVVRQVDTELHIDTAYMRLPNKKENRKLWYRTSEIKGKAVLTNISRTFAPVLKNFTMPLNLSVHMEGDDDNITFRNIKVYNNDKRIVVGAHGHINNLKDKYKLLVHFDIDHMTAKGGIKEVIIKQFPVKRLMMKQLHALGTLKYHGSFDVLWKKEEFRGDVNTKAGDINFYFAIDENNKYLSGRASTQSLDIGNVMDMPKIGPVAAKATFTIDISKPRTAIMRRRLGGKLPIGNVTAHVDKASYGILSVTDVDINIVSDGAVAQGDLHTPGKFADLSCTFSFTNTNEMQKMKVHPKMKIHLFGSKKTDEEKAQRKLEKQQAKEEKARLKAEKKAEKKAAQAQEKAAKAEEKAARDAEKAAKAEKKAQEKAARKAAKAEAKAAKAAEKAARKAAQASE